MILFSSHARATPDAASRARRACHAALARGSPHDAKHGWPEDPPALAVAALASHSVVAVAVEGEGAFFAFGAGDHGRCGVRDQFGRADPRDVTVPKPMALPAEVEARLPLGEYNAETRRRYPGA